MFCSLFPPPISGLQKVRRPQACHRATKDTGRTVTGYFCVLIADANQ